MSQFAKFLRIFLEEEKEDLWILIVYGTCVSICSLVIPIAVQMFVNTIGFGLLVQPILILTVIVFAVLLFSGTLRALQVCVTEVLQQRLFAKVAMTLALRIPQVDCEYFLNHRKVYETNYFLEIATLQKTATVLILDASAVFLQVIFGIILLAFYSPYLLGVNFIIFLFIVIFFFGFVKHAVETSIEESKAKYSVVFWLQEMATHSLDLRTAQSRAFAAQRTDELTTQYVLKRRRHFKVLFQQILAALALEILVSSLVLGVGGWLVVRGQLTLGQLVASELIVSVVVMGVGKFGKYLESYYDMAAALDKIGHLLDLPLERLDGESNDNSGDVQGPFLRVSQFQLDARSPLEAFGALSMDIRPGEKITFIGSDDSTRLQLIKTLCGLGESYSGAIEVQKVNLRYQSLEKIRSQMAYIGSSAMSGSLLDNLRFGNDSIHLSEIQDVLTRLGAHESITNLPDGLQTQVSVMRETHPALERKVLLARALLSKPKIILLGEVYDASYLQNDSALRTFFESDQHPFALLVHTRKLSDRLSASMSIGRLIDLDRFSLPEGSLA